MMSLRDCHNGDRKGERQSQKLSEVDSHLIKNGRKFFGCQSRRDPMFIDTSPLSLMIAPFRGATLRS